MNQQQSSNTAKKDIILQLLQSSVLKQRNLNDKISHEEISRLIDDIISLSEDNTGELRRSKRNLPSLLLPVFMLGVQTVALGSLGLALGASDFALIMYRVLSTQRGREIVMDLIDKALEGKDIMDTMEDLRRTGLFKTNEEQFTQIAEALLKGDAGVDVQDKDGRTPLYYAVYYTHGEHPMAKLSTSKSSKTSTKLWCRSIIYS
ncbi:MAG: hypothetical protein ABS808_05050 [Wolbachia endosymbiont of Polyergus mexicanus]|uniref:Uncharacterized protein n=1 Tax=Wolbachia endosymbiont of Polyergus mexicanus TaxID=3171167 RepID=A0AAU7YJR0_9RICK